MAAQRTGHAAVRLGWLYFAHPHLFSQVWALAGELVAALHRATVRVAGGGFGGYTVVLSAFCFWSLHNLWRHQNLTSSRVTDFVLRLRRFSPLPVRFVLNALALCLPCRRMLAATGIHAGIHAIGHFLDGYQRMVSKALPRKPMFSAGTPRLVRRPVRTEPWVCAGQAGAVVSALLGRTRSPEFLHQYARARGLWRGSVSDKGAMALD